MYETFPGDEDEAVRALQASLAWEQPEPKPDPFDGLIDPPPMPE